MMWDADTGLTYSIDANYLIFRDIDLAGAAWNRAHVLEHHARREERYSRYAE